MTRCSGPRSWLATSFAWLLATAAAPAQAPSAAPDPARPAVGATRTKDQPSADGEQEPKADRPAAGGPAAGGGARPTAPKTTERNYRGPYDAGTGRDLFRACDQDADDRLDVFEASGALDSLRDARDVDGFARLDTDRDGFVTWVEFDANFRRSLQRQGSFRVRTSRPLGGGSRGNSELQQFLRLYDADHDGALDPAEVEQLLRLGILPQGLGARLKTLDHDGSGRLEESELAAWYEQLPRPQRGAPERPGAGSLLPPPWHVCDADKDNTVALDELALALRKLDPTLQRWAAQLLAKLDKNGDGQLQPAELPVPPPAGAANPPAPLPKESTLR
jgi:Ca2+-binding EF-hand superfamily protein